MSNNTMKMCVMPEFSADLVPKLDRGLLFIISAPAGAGKTSLVYQLLKWFPSLELSITYTTRKPRHSEKHAVDYHFMSDDEFSRMEIEGDFLETVELHGNRYGSSRKDLEKIRSKGKHAIMVIDIHGAQKVRSLLDPILVFIKPPSVEVLKERMISRGSESEESLAKRLMQAETELAFEKQYHYSVMNDDFDKAVLTLASIFIAEVHKVR